MTLSPMVSYSYCHALTIQLAHVHVLTRQRTTTKQNVEQEVSLFDPALDF